MFRVPTLVGSFRTESPTEVGTLNTRALTDADWAWKKNTKHVRDRRTHNPKP